MKCKLLNMTWKSQDFSGGPVVKNLPASAGDMVGEDSACWEAN